MRRDTLDLELWTFDSAAPFPRMAEPIAGPAWTSQPLSIVRRPAIAQAVSASGSSHARQPEAPAWPNDAGLASTGAQWGDFEPRSSTPRPHGQGSQSSGLKNPPARPRAWFRVASVHSASLKNPLGSSWKARTSATHPCTVVIIPPQGSASDLQNAELYGSRSVPACSLRTSAIAAGERGGSAPKYASIPSGPKTCS